MSTIMSSGTRRCDAVCHRATKDKCGCICGGKYHGSAVRQPAALEEAKETAQRTRITAVREKELLDEQIQPRLFPARSPDYSPGSGTIESGDYK